jgi:hypothetical protein
MGINAIRDDRDREIAMIIENTVLSHVEEYDYKKLWYRALVILIEGLKTPTPSAPSGLDKEKI